MKKSSNGVGSSSSSSSSSLAPGFRFHPTDEELVSYYLYRKVRAKPFRFDAISDVEIYKVEPWDLPGLSKLKSRDLEWYFFSVLDKKYGIGCRTNRATAEGYWKTTGKDRSIQHKSRVVGMKKSLVFHRGRAPCGERTNWVMHEYRLVDEELDQKAGIVQQDFVLCRIFFKSGTGPMNGEKYGAPFVEEEWDMDDDDAEQNHVVILRLEDSAPPVNFYQGESSNFVQEPTKNGENGLKPLTIVDEGLCVLEANNDKTLINIEMQPETEATKSDSTAQPPIAVSHSLSDCQPEAQCFDNIDSIDEFFLEANDLLEPIEALPAGAAEFEPENYLTYFDVDDDIAPYLNFDTSELLDPDFTIVHPAVNENLYFGTERPSISNKQPAETYIAEGASASKEFLEVPISKSDSNYPFMKQASQMLGSFHAPPAFASEFPAKDMVARLQAAAAQSSDSVDVSAGMIKIRNSTMNDDSVMPWCFDKSGNFNVLVSFNLPLPEVMVSGTMASVFSRSWFYFFFFGATALAISAKVGTCIYAK